MRRAAKPPWAALVLLAGLLAAVSAAARPAPQMPTTQPELGRSVYGTVLNAGNRPISGAIVHLVNDSTKAVRTAVTDGRGGYEFDRLDAHASYHLQAEFKGHKSASRVASQYDPSAKLRLDLVIPVS